LHEDVADDAPAGAPAEWKNIALLKEKFTLLGNDEGTSNSVSLSEAARFAG
jgi:hypothetical protein